MGLDPKNEETIKFWAILIQKYTFTSPDIGILVSQILQKNPKFRRVSMLLSSMVKQSENNAAWSWRRRHYKTLSNSRPKIHDYISGHRGLVESNAAEKFRVSKRLSAVVFKGKSVGEQRCLILKTKTVQVFEQFSSKNTRLHPRTPAPWWAKCCRKSEVSKRLSAVVFKVKSVREQRCLILKKKKLQTF